MWRHLLQYPRSVHSQNSLPEKRWKHEKIVFPKRIFLEMFRKVLIKCIEFPRKDSIMGLPWWYFGLPPVCIGLSQCCADRKVQRLTTERAPIRRLPENYRVAMGVGVGAAGGLCTVPAVLFASVPLNTISTQATMRMSSLSSVQSLCHI